MSEGASVYQEFIRPMNEREREILTQLATCTKSPASWITTLKWSAVSTIGILIAVCTGLKILELEWNPLITACVMMLLIVAACACLYLTVSVIESYLKTLRYQKTFATEVIPKILQSIQNGMVSTRKVAAKAVIILHEFEDEGTGYLYDIGEDRTLYLKGQRYFPLDSKMSWPNNQFEIVRTVHDNLWIGIFCQGEQLIPVREIDLVDIRDEFICEEREEIIEQDLMDFAHLMTKVSH